MNHIYLDIEIIRDITVSDDLYDLAHEERRKFLSPYNRILCIGIGRPGEVKVYSGDEKDIIERLFATLSKMPASTRLVGYNLISFDLPFIVERALHHGIMIPKMLNFYDTKPWTVGDRVLDLGRALQGMKSSMMSLADACLLLGVESPKAGMDGSLVQMFHDNDRDRDIYDYCSRDVQSTIDIHTRLIDLNFL